MLRGLFAQKPGERQPFWQTDSARPRRPMRRTLAACSGVVPAPNGFPVGRTVPFAALLAAGLNSTRQATAGPTLEEGPSSEKRSGCSCNRCWASRICIHRGGPVLGSGGDASPTCSRIRSSTRGSRARHERDDPLPRQVKNWPVKRNKPATVDAARGCGAIVVQNSSCKCMIVDNFLTVSLWIEASQYPARVIGHGTATPLQRRSVFLRLSAIPQDGNSALGQMAV